jgi:SAM-dependent methyltransferase
MERREQHPGDWTVLTEETIGNLAPVRLRHPAGTFRLTPASIVGLQAVDRRRDLLAGTGIDWGSGTGCLAIVAAKLEDVRQIVGLEISESDVRVARENALLNGVRDKLEFHQADSYTPLNSKGEELLFRMRGKVDFILANPPASEDDDGFQFRRAVLTGAREYLRHQGIVFLNISYQYGSERIQSLSAEIDGFTHGGVIASTEWVPFDLDREDLLHCLELYAAEEERGGMPYAFRGECESVNGYRSARTVLERYRRTGQSPESKWQTHLFIFSKDG